LSEDFRHRSKRPSKADSTNKDNLYSVAGEYEKKGDDS